MKRLRLGLALAALFFAIQRNEVGMTLLCVILVAKIHREPPNTDPWRLID